MAGLQTMAACWRSSLWSCCLTDAPTWTQWVAADSGCWREGRGTATTQLTLSTWRTSRSGCHRSQTVADLEKSATIAESSLSLSRPLFYHMCVFLVSQVDGDELEVLQDLHDSVYQQAQDWYQRLGSRTREQINRQYGTMPEKEEDIQVWRNFLSNVFL